MKFVDFLKEGLEPSLDDGSILTLLDTLDIFYNRVKGGDGSYMYQFDNRYSMQYDGSTLVLFRHENRIHYGNARNSKEIEASISTWNDAYDLSSIEISDDDVDDIVSQMKANAKTGADDEEKSDETDDDTGSEDDSKDDGTSEYDDGYDYSVKKGKTK